jgi:type IV secretory pathway TrbD component
MSETILLVIFAIATFVIMVLLRRWPHQNSLSKRAEALIRLALCAVFALGSHAWYIHQFGLPWWFAVAANALVIYAVTHLLDRIILGESNS